MEVTIDAYVYDELKELADKTGEPISVLATKAIKKYME